MAKEPSDALGEQVTYHEITPELLRSFGFPGADEIGHMFQFYRDFDEVCNAIRDVDWSRELNLALHPSSRGSRVMPSVFRWSNKYGGWFHLPIGMALSCRIGRRIAKNSIHALHRVCEGAACSMRVGNLNRELARYAMCLVDYEIAARSTKEAESGWIALPAESDRRQNIKREKT